MHEQMYMFGVSDAVKYGIESAIVYWWIQIGMMNPQADIIVFPDGFRYIRMYQDAIQRSLPWWSRERIRRILTLMQAQGLIVVRTVPGSPSSVRCYRLGNAKKEVAS